MEGQRERNAAQPLLPPGRAIKLREPSRIHPHRVLESTGVGRPVPHRVAQPPGLRRWSG